MRISAIWSSFKACGGKWPLGAAQHDGDRDFRISDGPLGAGQWREGAGQARAAGLVTDGAGGFKGGLSWF